jgi:hypothetical protein
MNQAFSSPGNDIIASREWLTIVEPLMPIGGRMASLLPDTSDPQLRNEFYRYLYQKVASGYLALLHADPEHPDFWPIYHVANSSLAANPDDTYYASPIDAQGSYRISGHRGTSRIVDFQIGSGPLFATGTGTLGPVCANYDLDTLTIAQDRTFEVILSPERPAGYAGNWWKLEPQTTYLLARQIFYDWHGEVDGRFAIERLDRPAIRPRMSAERLAKSLRHIAEWTESWTKFELAWPRNLRNKGLVNQLLVHDLTSVGGLSTQQYIEGMFEVNAGEALIYESEIPERSRYWNIQLTDELWCAIDWMNRQTSLNGHSAVLDSDGKFRAVVCGEDPGVPNWLDSAGYTKGIFFGRWTECSSYPQPTIRRVKLADLRKHLPADTPVVSAEARDIAIRLRRKGAQLRHRW